MNRIVLILLLFISISSFCQTRVIAPLVRNSLVDSGYGTHSDSLGYGGYMTFTTLSNRNTKLPIVQRRLGMQVYVAETDSVYALSGGLFNGNWFPLFKLSNGISGGNASNADSLGHVPASQYYVQGGNSFGASAILGTKDSNPLRFITNNTPWLNLDVDGNLFSLNGGFALNTDGSAYFGNATVNIDNLGNTSVNTLAIDNITSTTDTINFNPIVIDVNGNTRKLTFWPGGGVGTLDQVVASGDTTGRMATVNTLIKNADYSFGFQNIGYTPSSNTISDSVWYFGNSITFGTGASSTIRDFVNIHSTMIKTVPVNKGIAGTRLTFNSTGDSSMVDRIYLIPNKRTGIRGLVFEYTTNDYLQSKTPAQVRAAWIQVLDTAIARGFAPSQITITGITLLGSGNSTQFAIDTASKNVAAQLGVNFADVYKTLLENGGGINEVSDSTHPNDRGHLLYAYTINNAWKTTNKVFQNIFGDQYVSGNDSITGNVNIGNNSNLTFGNSSFGYNNILLYNGANKSTTHNYGLGMTTGAQTALFSGVDVGFRSALLFGVGFDATNMTQANSSFYVDSVNRLTYRNTVAGTLSWGLGFGFNNILTHDGGNSTNRYGMATQSNAQAIFGGAGTPILFGNGFDASTLTVSNAAMYVDGSNLTHITRLRDSLTFGIAKTGNKYLVNSTITGIEAGLGWDSTNAALRVEGISGKNILIGQTANASLMTPQNVALATINNNVKFPLTPQITSNYSLFVRDKSDSAIKTLPFTNLYDTLNKQYFAQGGNSFGINTSIGNNDIFSLSLRTAGQDRMTIGASGNFAYDGLSYFGSHVATPTDYVTISAGTNVLAPIKLTPGLLLITPRDGAVEYDGSNYYGTVSTTRYNLTKSLSTTATLDFPSTNGGSSSDTTITLTGVVDGDKVVVSSPNSTWQSGSFYLARGSGTNTITVSFYNIGTLPINPTSGTFSFSVIK